MNLDTISAWFESVGVHPLLGGFLAGVALMLLLILLRLASRDTPQPDSVTRPHSSLSGPRPTVQKSTFEVTDSTVAFKVNDMPIPPEHSAQIMDLIRSKQTIEAIKAVRLHSGLGLAEAKNVVEMLEKNLPRS